MIPLHYAREITQRCGRLLERMMPIAAATHEEEFGGSLETTLLLALSTPMIVLPIERMFKPTRRREVTADERELDTTLGAAVTSVFADGCTWRNAPFVAGTRWSYVPGQPWFNAANLWPTKLLAGLGSAAAFEQADQTTAREMLLDLRNALAHGGIAYLHSNGQQIERGRAEYFAFACAGKRIGKQVTVNVLRVHQSDFRSFDPVGRLDS